MTFRYLFLVSLLVPATARSQTEIANVQEIVICARIEDIGHIHARSPGQMNTFPYLVTITPLKLLTDASNADIAVGKSMAFRIRDPRLSFGESEAKLTGRSLKVTLIRMGDNLVLGSGHVDVSCANWPANSR
ncbi:MAG: hypothetical protein U0136_07540 [Bdellovibrionota bacterium]